MSPSAQALAEGAVARTLKSLDNKRRPPLQSGLVVTDVHNGEVRRGGRQPQLRRARLQPRGRSAASGRFAAQAVRVPAGAGAAGQVFAGELGRRFAGHRRAGQGQELEPRQFRRPQPRHRAPDRCAGDVLQPGHRARGHAGRARARRRPDPHPGRHRGRAESFADPRRGRPEPVRDGAAVPVPRLRRRDPAAARGARRARRQRQGASTATTRRRRRRRKATPSPRA